MWGLTATARVAARSRQPMNPMRTRRGATIQDLRRAIECLPDPELAVDRDPELATDRDPELELSR